MCHREKGSISFLNLSLQQPPQLAHLFAPRHGSPRGPSEAHLSANQLLRLAFATWSSARVDSYFTASLETPLFTFSLCAAKYAHRMCTFCLTHTHTPVPLTKPGAAHATLFLWMRWNFAHGDFSLPPISILNKDGCSATIRKLKSSPVWSRSSPQPWNCVQNHSLFPDCPLTKAGLNGLFSTLGKSVSQRIPVVVFTAHLFVDVFNTCPASQVRLQRMMGYVAGCRASILHYFSPGIMGYIECTKWMDGWIWIDGCGR